MIEVSVKSIIQTPQGCALLIGNEDKTFIIHVSSGIGMAISMLARDIKKVRPLTHDLIGSILRGFNVRLEKVVINDLRDNTFFARIYLHSENGKYKRILEIDARPSDSIALAIQQKAKIYIDEAVFDQVEDIGKLFEK